jgi:hypothetical protein
MNILRAFFLCAAVLAGCGKQLPPVREGDIIFHTSRSNQSVAIQKATHSPYSHMGIILFRDSKPYVLEASATVRYTPLGDWIKRGIGGHYVLKRLMEPDKTLSKKVVKDFHDEAAKYEGKPYDFTFEWSDDKMYCSELVWKLYQRVTGLEIGKMQTMRDFDLTDTLVSEKMRERFGDHVPLDTPVISPQAMFESPLLMTVTEE